MAPVILLASSLLECGERVSPVACTSEAISVGPRAVMIFAIERGTNGDKRGWEEGGSMWG